jgi:hypothetical protein
MQWWPSFVILLLIGGGVVPVWLFLGKAIRPGQENRSTSSMLAFVYAGLIALPAIGFYGLFLFVTAYPPLLSLVATSIPTLAALLYLMVPNDSGGPAPA